MPPKLSATERRIAGAQARLLAKMSEFTGWAVVGDQAGMTTCREEASALLDSFFDLTETGVAEHLRGRP